MAAMIRAARGGKPDPTPPRRRKTTAPTTGVTKVPQPHGGALNSGGTPGNRGGLGRPSSEIKARLRGSFYDRIPTLEGIADGAVPMRQVCTQCGFSPDNDEPVTLPAATADRLRALDIMAKYGGDEDDVSADEVRRRLTKTIDTIRARLDAAVANELIAALEPVWA